MTLLVKRQRNSSVAFAQTSDELIRLHRLTTGSCGRRGQRAVFPDAFVAGAAQPER